MGTKKGAEESESTFGEDDRINILLGVQLLSSS